YVGAPADLLRRALAGPLILTTHSKPAHIENFYIPAQHNATFPWVSHALWFHAQIVRWKQIDFSPDHLAAVRTTYRPDLYRAALTAVNPAIPTSDSKLEHFFDGTTFDPAELDAVR